MVGGVSGGAGFDPTKGFEKVPDVVKDMDLKKQVRKAKVQPTDEEIIDGVTHDSIAEFVEASKAAKHAARNPLTFGERVRRFFGRA